LSRRSLGEGGINQFESIMQNKPNLQKSQVIVKHCKKMTYENKSNWTLGGNKPNTNPNKPNLPDGKK